MRFLLVAVVLFISGCSLFGDRYRDRSLDYLRTTEQAPTLTQDATVVPYIDRYPIPESAVDLTTPEKFVAPGPEPLVLEERGQSRSDDGSGSGGLDARIERDGAGTLIQRVDGSCA